LAGILINENNDSIKISQLADDITIFLRNVNEIPIVLNILDKLGLHSGLKTNKTKTEGILLGKSKLIKETVIHGIEFKQYVKALGIFFSTDRATAETLNWDAKIEQTQQTKNIN